MNTGNYIMPLYNSQQPQYLYQNTHVDMYCKLMVVTHFLPTKLIHVHITMLIHVLITFHYLH